MDSATSAPISADDAAAAGDDNDDELRVSIHPSTLVATSSLLAAVVNLLSSFAADPNTLVRAKHMYDMTRVLLAELPVEAAIDRL
jgi:hypothetical protein